MHPCRFSKRPSGLPKAKPDTNVGALENPDRIDLADHLLVRGRWPGWEGADRGVQGKVVMVGEAHGHVLLPRDWPAAASVVTPDGKMRGKAGSAVSSRVGWRGHSAKVRGRPAQDSLAEIGAGKAAEAGCCRTRSAVTPAFFTRSLWLRHRNRMAP